MILGQKIAHNTLFIMNTCDHPMITISGINKYQIPATKNFIEHMYALIDHVQKV